MSSDTPDVSGRLNAALLGVKHDDQETLAQGAMMAILDGVDDPDVIEDVGMELVSEARKHRGDRE
jgi:hypothetical protein